MLSVTLPIQVASIETITCLADNHPVFLLEGHRDDRIVVKREMINGQQSALDIAHNGRVMGVSSAAARAYVAGPSEVKAMESWAFAQIQRATSREKVALHGFLCNVQTPGPWVKMQYHSLLDLDHARSKLARNDKSEVRLIAKIMNSPGGMEKLGEIVVCDMFNGNQDRFAFPHPFNERQSYGNGFKKGYDTEHGQRDQFYHLVNVGNILVTRGKGASPIGLDSWDPTSFFTNWKTSLAASEAHLGEGWPGRHLAPNAAVTRRKIAERCVDDLNLVLGLRNRRLKVFSKLRLNKNAADRMTQGMETAIAQLKIMLRRYSGRTCPTGLRDRCAVMGFNL